MSHINQIAVLVSSKLQILKNVVAGHSQIGMTVILQLIKIYLFG
jgi:hypothetical protein